MWGRRVHKIAANLGIKVTTRRLGRSDVVTVYRVALAVPGEKTAGQEAAELKIPLPYSNRKGEYSGLTHKLRDMAETGRPVDIPTAWEKQVRKIAHNLGVKVATRYLRGKDVVTVYRVANARVAGEMNWIRCSERLPEINADVLASKGSYVAATKLVAGCGKKSGKVYWQGRSSSGSECFDHWMPFPKPPITPAATDPR
jgi:hypothetical protein